MTPRELLLWRIDQGMTQTDLAEALDVHPNSIGNWEHGRTEIPLAVELAIRYLDGEKKAPDVASAEGQQPMCPSANRDEHQQRRPSNDAQASEGMITRDDRR